MPIKSMPISESRMERIKSSLLADEVGMELLHHIENEWPSFEKCSESIRKFFTFKDHLTAIEGLIFYGERIFIPPAERGRVLQDIHKGHQGEVKCIRRATELVWWPGMTSQIREMVKLCSTCCEFRVIPREPLISTAFPERP